MGRVFRKNLFACAMGKGCHVTVAATVGAYSEEEEEEEEEDTQV